MASRWPIRLLTAGLGIWYARFGLRRRKPPSMPRRILVAHHLLLGDTIMLTPLLKKLRTQFPDAEIVMTCRPAFSALFDARPYGVRAIPFDPRHARTFRALFRIRGFDLALLPADNRFSWLARGLDSRWIIAFEGDRPAYKNWLVDDFRSFPEEAAAWGDFVADRLVDGPAPEPYLTSEWPASRSETFALPSKRYCVLHVGASSPLKLWAAERWRAIARYVELQGLQPVLSCGRGEESLLQEIDADLIFPRYPGTLDLAQLRVLLESADALICPDTGVGHLARITGTPSVLLFGPGSPKLFGGGQFWRHSPNRNVTIPAFPCRNENMIFHRFLPWAEHCGRTTAECAHPKCMEALSVESVIDGLRSLGIGQGADIDGNNVPPNGANE